MDDMNATPLDKLPPPVMQTKMDQPRMDSPPTYTDILHDMDVQKNDMPDQRMQFASQQQGYAQQTMPPPMEQQYTTAPPSHQYQQQPQHSQYMPQHHGGYYESQGPPPQHYTHPPPPTYAQPTSDPSKSSFFVSIWASNKHTIIVACIVLVLLLFVMPRFKAMPRFTSDGMSLNALGTVTTALLGAVTFKIASQFA